MEDLTLIEYSTFKAPAPACFTPVVEAAAYAEARFMTPAEWKVARMAIGLPTIIGAMGLWEQDFLSPFENDNGTFTLASTN